MELFSGFGQGLYLFFHFCDLLHEDIDFIELLTPDGLLLFELLILLKELFDPGLAFFFFFGGCLFVEVVVLFKQGDLFFEITDLLFKFFVVFL